MTQRTSDRTHPLARLAAAAALAIWALPALAQTSASPTSAPVADPGAKKAQEAHDLAQAAFAKPGARPASVPPEPTTAAAKIASEAAEAKAAAPVEPKPEWLSDEGVRLGGKGVQFKSPF
ncbi:hypothetical protein [Phenylobacterium sp.]|uniref:hypothetical protein n=1 Tax=Phenylobacterium sp. TaxID=1871053 RepID=UPI0035689D37